MSGESAENTFTPEEAITETRAKYLKAFAVSLGADETYADLTTNMLIEANANNGLPSLDYTKARAEQPPDTIKTIELIGSWFLTGSPKQDALKYTAGARVLSLLKEDPKSGYFTNLSEHVSYMTDGEGVGKFQELINK
jgi:hypothetical protein